MKRNKLFVFIAIVILFLISFTIDLPPMKILGHTFSHPFIDFSIGSNTFVNSLDPSLGLDLKGGTQLILQADMSKISSNQRDQAIASARDVIEKRVNLYGVSEPNIYTEKIGNDYRIVAELAGVKDINAAKDLIGKTAKLEFLTLKSSSPVIPGDTTINDYNSTTNLTGADLSGASIVYQSGSVTPSIQLNFKPEGLTKFQAIAAANVNKPVGISLDGQIISAPTIQPNVVGSASSPVIEGNYTVQAAQELVNQLDAGALPVPVNIIGESTVAPSLGQQSINASVVAGIVGIIMVLLFMIINYGKLGLIADVALILYALVTYAIYILLPVTLTLAGIAGFILSIGMAVDANILIFERMKEEQRKGKSRSVTLRLGFERAWTSIRDSNISSLITTIILYTFGTSIIKGFALTLAIGVMVSMFTAVFVTRNLLDIFYNRNIVIKDRNNKLINM